MFVTVEILQKWLSAYTKETLVFMSSDEEGNSIMPMSNGIGDVECDSKGKIYYESKPKKVVPGIILYPQHKEAEEEY